MKSEVATNIQFHGRLADLLGRDLQIEAPDGCSIGDIRSRIADEHPHAAKALRAERVRVCVGDSIVSDSHRIAPGDQVEFLPPVSGG